MATTPNYTQRILNVDALTGHGNIAGRRAMVEILEAGLRAADPYTNTRCALRVEGDRLIVGGADFKPKGAPWPDEVVYDLSKTGRIFVFGAGKGIQGMARAVEDTLGDRLTGGHVIAKHGDPVIVQRVGVTHGAHPVPDEGCVEGCRRILEMTRDLQPEDLVFTVVSNGVSALLTLPSEGVTLEDVRRVTYLMQIERGAPTRDLNPVRNHIDRMKGGRLARYCQPARTVNLVAYNPDTYDSLMYHNVWLHSLPEGSTFAYAREMLHRWDAWEQAPASVRAVLERADPALETVKADEFQRMGGVIFCTMPAHLGMLQTARRKAEALGFNTLVLTTWHNTEASQLGMVYADIANSIERHGLPVEPPCALLSGGEMLVTVGQETGMGGRNQEYALAAALRISGSPNIVMGSVDSDGTDGPGRQFIQGYDHIPDLGGGIVDGQTNHAAPTLGVDLRDALKRHDTSPALWALDDAVEISKNISVTDLTVTLVMARGENSEWSR